MAEFVCGVKTVTLGSFRRAEENIWLPVCEKGKCIETQIRILFPGGENSDAMQLEQLNHVADWLISEIPMRAKELGGGFRPVSSVDAKRIIRKILFREGIMLLDPGTKLDSLGGDCDRSVLVPHSRLGRSAER